MKMKFFAIALFSMFMFSACSQQGGNEANSAPAQKVECTQGACDKACDKAEGCKKDCGKAECKKGACDKASCADGCKNDCKKTECKKACDTPCNKAEGCKTECKK